jgi:hypothetical protein
MRIEYAVCFGCDRPARCRLIFDHDDCPPVTPLCSRCYPPRVPAELVDKEPPK